MTPPRSGKALDTSARSSSSSEVSAFLERVNALGAAAEPSQRGRLIFAMDATMSRQPTWDMAIGLQAEMFRAIPADRHLMVQLLYFRGIGECRASKWVEDPSSLSRLMSGIACQGGNTQIGRVFSHARQEHARERVNALVYVGDAMEENVDRLAQAAGELGLLGCPVFVFQEGREPVAEGAFREFARVSKGAYARFDAGAPKELGDLLRAVAAYATGGRNALKLQSSRPARLLLEQMGK